MYGIFINMCPKNHPNVGKYTIHGAYGYDTSNHREAHQERFVLPPGSPYGPRPSWPTKECQAHWALMKIDGDFLWFSSENRWFTYEHGECDDFPYLSWVTSGYELLNID